MHVTYHISYIGVKQIHITYHKSDIKFVGVKQMHVTQPPGLNRAEREKLRMVLVEKVDQMKRKRSQRQLMKRKLVQKL